MCNKDTVCTGLACEYCNEGGEDGGDKEHPCVYEVAVNDVAVIDPSGKLILIGVHVCNDYSYLKD